MIGADTITVQRAALSTADRYGARHRDWATPVSHTVRGVSVQPYAANTEATVDREYTATHLRLLAPPGADIAATDRVVWRGVTFEVDGDPQAWIDLGGRRDHIEVSLKRMTG